MTEPTPHDATEKGIQIWIGAATFLIIGIMGASLGFVYNVLSNTINEQKKDIVKSIDTFQLGVYRMEDSINGNINKILAEFVEIKDENEKTLRISLEIQENLRKDREKNSLTFQNLIDQLQKDRKIAAKNVQDAVARVQQLRFQTSKQIDGQMAMLQSTSKRIDAAVTSANSAIQTANESIIFAANATDEAKKLAANNDRVARQLIAQTQEIIQKQSKRIGTVREFVEQLDSQYVELNKTVLDLNSGVEKISVKLNQVDDIDTKIEPLFMLMGEVVDKKIPSLLRGLSDVAPAVIKLSKDTEKNRNTLGALNGSLIRISRVTRQLGKAVLGGAGELNYGFFYEDAPAELRDLPVKFVLVRGEPHIYTSNPRIISHLLERGWNRGSLKVFGLVDFTRANPWITGKSPPVQDRIHR